MSRVVLDASALLAYLGDEAGAGKVKDAISRGAYLSTINWAEVLSKLCDRGLNVRAAAEDLIASGLIGGAIELAEFSADDAKTVAELRLKTKMLGLSLADRSCLALGLRLGLPALTSDRSWMGLHLGVAVRSIR